MGTAGQAGQAGQGDTGNGQLPRVVGVLEKVDRVLVRRRIVDVEIEEEAEHEVIGSRDADERRNRGLVGQAPRVGSGDVCRL